MSARLVNVGFPEIIYNQLFDLVLLGNRIIITQGEIFWLVYVACSAYHLDAARDTSTLYV